MATGNERVRFIWRWTGEFLFKWMKRFSQTLNHKSVWDSGSDTTECTSLLLVSVCCRTVHITVMSLFLLCINKNTCAFNKVQIILCSTVAWSPYSHFTGHCSFYNQSKLKTKLFYFIFAWTGFTRKCSYDKADISSFLKVLTWISRKSCITSRVLPRKESRKNTAASAEIELINPHKMLTKTPTGQKDGTINKSVWEECPFIVGRKTALELTAL